jgi:pimeloyl-ACP methyl ester carboxylesterase
LLMRLLAVAPPGLRVPRVPAPLARRLGYGAAAPSDLVAQVRRGLKAPRARSVGAWYRALMEVDETASLTRLRDVPVTVLAGEADRLTPSSHARRIGEELPHARLEVVPGTGHMLLFEHPDTVSEHLLYHLLQK